MGTVKDKFVIKRVDVGRLNALVINLMETMGTDSPDEAVTNMNSLKWIPQPSDRGWWFDETDETLIRARLRRHSNMRPSEWGRALLPFFKVSDEARTILFNRNDLDFSSEYDEIVIIPGSDWDDTDRITSSIIYHGTQEYSFVRLKPEDACIMRDRLTEQDFKRMGLTGIVTMHKPIDGHRFLVSESEKKQQVFRTMSAPDTFIWPKSFGFAFGVVPSK